MFTTKSLIVLLIAAVLLAGCAPAATQPPSAQAFTQPPAVTQPPSAPVATQLPAASVASQDPSGKFEGLSSGLDNATQARIRAVNLVMGAPNVDMYVNGMPAFNGGIAQQNIGAGLFSGFLYVKPGTYSIALVPEGGKLDQTLFKPVDVKAEAGHRYTVAAIGQLADKDVHPLVVDETAIEAGLNANISDAKTIDVNNLKGADSITEQAYGKTVAENIKYGEALAYLYVSGSPLYTTLATKDGKTEVVFQGNFPAEPATSYFIPWFGPYPAANYDSVGNSSQGTSELNAIDFLAGFDGRNVNMDGHLFTFNTFLKIIDKAGLRDQLVSGGPYFLLAPTDEAFSKLSKADLDALLNDPQALKNFLNAYLVDGYYPFGNLSGAVYGHADRIVTNRLGQKLAFHEDNLNGQPIGPNYTVGNGNRVQIIYSLLPSK